MNVNAIVCQIGQLAGTLHHGGMGSYSMEDLNTLADSLEQARNVVYAEMLHRRELEQEANPIKGNAPSGGLLDALTRRSSEPSDGGDAA